jgi:hypothetical protein
MQTNVFGLLVSSVKENVNCCNFIDSIEIYALWCKILKQAFVIFVTEYIIFLLVDIFCTFMTINNLLGMFHARNILTTGPYLQEHRPHLHYQIQSANNINIILQLTSQFLIS